MWLLVPPWTPVRVSAAEVHLLDSLVLGWPVSSGGTLGLYKCPGAQRAMGTGNLIIVLERQLLLHAATIEFTGENKSGRTEIGPNIIKCCHRLQRLQYLWSVLQTNLIKPVLASA